MIMSSSYGLFSIVNDAFKVLTGSKSFFSHMPKKGYKKAISFLLFIVVVTGLFKTVCSVSHYGFFEGLSHLPGNLLVMLLYVFVIVTLGSGVMYYIWRLMGSEQSFETSFKNVSYSLVALPLLMIAITFGFYAIVLVMALWAFILFNAGNETHQVRGTGIVVFLGLGVLLSSLMLNGLNSDKDKSKQEQSENKKLMLEKEKLREDEGAIVDEELIEQLLEKHREEKINERRDHHNPDYYDKHDQNLINEYKEEGVNESNTLKSEAEQIAEDAGHSLGSMIRNISDVAENIKKDIQQGLDNTDPRLLLGTEKVATDEELQAFTEELKQKQAASASESETSLEEIAEDAGSMLGSVMKTISETANNFTEDFKRGLEQVDETSSEEDGNDQSSQEIVEPVSEKSEAKKDEKTHKVLTEELTQNQLSSEELSPEELGKAVGEFIRQIDSIAQSANDGFEEGMQDETGNQLIEKAGKAFGEFLKGYNNAVESDKEVHTQ